MPDYAYPYSVKRMQEANYQLSDCTSLHSLIRAHSYGPSGGLVGRPKVEISEH